MTLQSKLSTGAGSPQRPFLATQWERWGARLAALTLFTGLLLPGGALQAAGLTPQEKELVINGPYYKQLVQQKDLVADILPPPAYIIESYLTVLRLIDALETSLVNGKLDAAGVKRLDALIDYGVKLKNGSPGVFPGYYERIEVWKKELSEATPDEKLIKKLLVERSAKAATQFYELRDTQFIPLVKAGDVKAAKALARTGLKPLYVEHRAAIDAVVSRSRRVNDKIEKEVADLLGATAKEVPFAKIRIKSDLYNKVIQMKDLVSDILPPPYYIIESYLTVLQQIDETEIAMTDGSINANEKVVLEGLVDYGRQLEVGDSSKGEMAGYKERAAFWVSDLATDSPDAQAIKALTVKASYEPAMKFYAARNSQFLPLIGKGSVEEAKKVVRQELVPLYEEHRKHIDALVAASNASYDKIQAKVDALLGAKK